MSPRPRRQFTGQQKVEIVKRHLVDGVAVSTLCEEYKIQPTQFYTWQKQLFENGEKVSVDLCGARLQGHRFSVLCGLFATKSCDTPLRRP